ncbi:MULTISPECIES: DUF3800 domain-containing protein [Polynucleobacter]|uniref:DUF3800 domain-containing protein n=1 Tax=Polynucleobacter TaxID=44013 RepID=UPI0009ED9091|nr:MULTISPECIES: DUF3800 domain-containing protein [Polynucleobacter]MBU3552325.1 DUF3800 domain-containing protein [Polynucleobacter sp. MWH-Post4-6-1]
MTDESTSEQYSLFNPPEGVNNGKYTPLRDVKYSDYIVYVDESGDHGMQTLDPEYPVFVLACCVFHKRHYAEVVAPSVQGFKFKNFGHDLVVLHEHEIRKEKKPFKFQNKKHKNGFIEELTTIIGDANFVLITCVINKDGLRATPSSSTNPYHLALGFCLETLFEFMQEKSQDGLLTHVLVEQRGKKEDGELELEFRRICDGQNKYSKTLPFDVYFADKKVNSSGLQFADLIARPVGLSILRPQQSNRAFDVLRSKFYCAGGRKEVGKDFIGWGLKVFPGP